MIFREVKLAWNPGATAEQVRDSFKFAWPWSREWWKPKTRRYDLIRAAALIVAEIERLDRISRERSEAGLPNNPHQRTRA